MAGAHAEKAATPTVLVPLTLVPVRVFGDHCDCHEDRQHANPDGCHGFIYGLMDAVQAWSDCNRAIGHIYRVEDLPSNREPGESVTIYVERESLPFFREDWSEE